MEASRADGGVVSVVVGSDEEDDGDVGGAVFLDFLLDDSLVLPKPFFLACKRESIRGDCERRPTVDRVENPST